MSSAATIAGRGSGRSGPAIVLAGLRHVAGVVFGGLVGGTVWLVVIQEGPERNWSDHDYNEMMGQVFVNRAGDVAKTGLWATLAIGVALTALYALVVDPLLAKRGARRAALTFAAVPFLLWGLAFAPTVTAYRDTAAGVPREPIPGGVFGLDGGAATLVLGLAASFLFALAAARIYRLMCTGTWWRARGRGHELAQEVLEELTSRSFELPEERREESREGAGR
jgi:hypothetical protein